MSSAANESSNVSTKVVSNDEYTAFVEQIELESLWLMQGRVENRSGIIPVPGEVRVQMDEHSTWSLIEDGFRAESRYRIRVVSKSRKVLGLVEAVYGVNYSSQLPMTDVIFANFGKYNLPFNTWPYYREFVATSFARMNWPPVLLPLRKRIPARTSSPRTEE